MDFQKAVKKANLDIYQFLSNTPRDVLCTKHNMGIGGDISIYADLEAERIFSKYLLSFGQIYSEESGFIGKGDKTIIIDPIDGSDNLKSNIPYFGTSVALKDGDRVTHAIVTNLANGDIYIKTDDFFQIHSMFNEKKINVTHNAFSSVGIFERAYSSSLPSIFKELSFKYRSPGALALSLCLAHSVDFVLFEGKIREFDIAAGWKMCEDIYRYRGENFLLVSKDKNIFDKIYPLIENEGK